ncbi:sodium:solute symporter family protein [Labilibaculum euxinus]|uniref:Na+:solute symporter n=1 Tax=Labilibaculum euxinus TaxID=2686357 RepID=A0A7M4D961_9BACT|nr:sodium:solute symporter family protein [Labilibaculum euxinus]MUP39190.1 Na+:solute symporter [Labilibaculum euxinus]MVB08395.1 Na+:solute symporter [Labilibaculum euxinus]
MQLIDWIVLSMYFLVLVAIGLNAFRKVKNSADFFTAGGKLPWWLSGVSHHVSGYSGAVFVAYAGIAYTNGFSLYIWWACGVGLATLLAALWIAPRWAKLRIKTGIQSPTEYLLARYNLTTQQIIAWSGAIIKVFDVGGKLAAIAVLLNIFTGSSLTLGILMAGGVSLLYITIGGLWADVWNDFAQFVIQLFAGITMFVMILMKLGDGVSGIFTLWDRLPETNSHLFNDPYTPTFALGMLFINFFSYSGGTWNLATRFISSSSGSEARKAGILSSILYFIWPLFLLFPMFAAPIFFKDLADPTLSYGMMAIKFLPVGLLGLVLASMFANTLSMTASDSNTVSAVITRDILPVVFHRIRKFTPKRTLVLARLTTFSFTVLTIIAAINSRHFGGVFGLIVSWFASLLGPIAIPMILGLLPMFKRCGSKAALVSIFGGLLAFAITKIIPDFSLATEVAAPMLTSLILYILTGYLIKNQESVEVNTLLASLNEKAN